MATSSLASVVMRQSLICAAVLSALAAASAQSQRPTGCTSSDGVNNDSLAAQARRLHPDVMKPENQSGFVVVALVYDNHCSLVRHAMKRVPRMANIETILAAVFPDSSRVTLEAFEISGFMALGAASRETANERPVVAWGILTPRGIPRRP